MTAEGSEEKAAETTVETTETTEGSTHRDPGLLPGTEAERERETKRGSEEDLTAEEGTRTTTERGPSNDELSELCLSSAALN